MLHPFHAGEPEIDVIVRQQKTRGAEKFCGSFFSATKFRRGVAWQNRVAARSMRPFTPPKAFANCSHCDAVEVSHQSFAGRTTFPFLSKTTSPCCCPLTPIAATSSRRAPIFSKHSRTVASTASIQTCGSVRDVPAAIADESISLLSGSDDRAGFGVEHHGLSCFACRCRCRG